MSLNESYSKEYPTFRANKISIGQVYPLEIPSGLQSNGGIFEILDNGMAYQLVIADNPSPSEIKTFNAMPLKLRAYGDLDNGKNIFYVDTNIAAIENVFNPKLYTDDRMQKLLDNNETTLFVFILMDQNKIVRSIKVFYLSDGNTAWKTLKDIWRKTLVSSLTKDQYTEWYETNVLSRTIPETLKRSCYLGKATRYSLVENFCFMEDINNE